MSAITAKASRKMKKYAVLTREPRCFLGSFDFSWEQRKLSEMCGTFEYGLNAAAKEFDGKNKYIRITDIDDASREFLLSDLSSPAICLDGMSKYLLSSGDIVFARTGASVGKTYIYRENDGIVYFAGFLIRAKVNQNNDAEFVFQSTLSPSYEKYIRITSQRSGQPGVNAQEYGEYDLFAPSKEEQQRIGHFLRGIDNLITLHQRKCVFLFGFFQAFISMIFTASTFSWEQRKLGDIADIVGGGTPSTGNQSYWDGDIDWYAPAEIADQIYVNSSQKKITGLGYENSSAKMLPPGTVLFTSRAGIGKTAILTRKGCTNQGFQSIVPHRGELDSYFIFSRTEELKRYGELVGAGSTFVEVSGKQMAVMELMMPPTMREQQTIGGFFQQLDHLITLHQRECISFTARAGRLILTANKKRNTSSWEQRKLGDVVQITMGQSPDGSTYSDEPSDYILVQGNADLQNGWVCPRIWTTQITKKADAGDLIMSVRAPAGAMGKTAYNAVIGRGVAAIKGNEFIYQLLVKMDADGFWKTLSCGSTFESLNSDNIKNAEVKIPTTAEQIKIGGYFQQLDNLITLHQRKPFLMKWRTSDANRNQTNRLVL